MEEKTLIVGKQYNVKRFVIIFVIIFSILCIAVLALMYVYDYRSKYNEYAYAYDNSHLYEGCRHTHYDDVDEYSYFGEYMYGFNDEGAEEFFSIIYSEHPDLDSYLECAGIDIIWCWYISFYPLIPIPILILIYFWFSKYSLTVTDKRVYGKCAFGKRVDLPIDKISAIGTSFIKGIDIGTSSGKIKFKLIKNNKDVHQVLSTLLLERQQQSADNIAAQTAPNPVESLKSFKQLLDDGIITQEEFEQKKEQILGL